MVLVSGMTTVATPGTAVDHADREETVEQIIAAYEPVVLSQRRVLARVWKDRSISKRNMHLLMLLEAHGPLSMSELAAHAESSLPNLTGTIGRMEELGLVRRSHSEDDRRRVNVRATAKGRALVQQIELVRRGELRRILLKLTPEEQALCLQAMQAMARAATETP